MPSSQDHDELLQVAQALLRIPSVTSHELEMARYVQGYLEPLGFSCSINEYNSIVSIGRFGLGPTILLDAHIDTVDANPSEWAHGPYAGIVEKGRLYGRGASDMKGALAAMIVAAKRLAQAGSSLRGTLVLTGTSWEEYFEGYTLGKAMEQLSHLGLRPDAVIIGEASELNVKRGQRGRTRVYCDVKGRAAHSAHPEQGINAVYQAAVLIDRVRRLALPTDAFLGQGIVELVGIQSQPQPVDSVVPYQCRVSYDLRLLPGETREAVLERFHSVVRDIQGTDPQFAADFQIASGELITAQGCKEIVEAFPPAWKTSEDHPLVQKALSALRAVGQSPKITKYDFCTNGSYSAGIAGVPTIGFGPGKETTAHIVDEFIELGELEQACKGYLAIVQRLLAE